MPVDGSAVPDGRGRKSALAGVALGFVTLAAQVLLLRELWCATWGSEALAGAAVALWLAAGGAGSALGAFLLRRLPPAAYRLPSVLCAFGLAVPGAILLLRWWPAAAGDAPGAVPDLARSALYALASVGTVGFLAGALFPLVLNAISAHSGDTDRFRGSAPDFRSMSPNGAAARLYRWDMIGSLLAGALLAASVLAFGLGGLRGALIVGALALGLAAWLVEKRCLTPFLFVAAALLAGLTLPDLDHRTLAWRYRPETLVSVSETAAGRLAVTGREGQVNAYLSGRFAASPGAVERAEALAAVAGGECARPERALLLGDALGAAAPQLAAHGFQVTAVVPDHRAALSAASCGATLLAGDARAALRDGSASYDLIVIDAGAPETFAQGRLLTRECFARARHRLTDNGVLAVVLPANPAHLSVPERRAAGGVWKALGSVFAERRLWAFDQPGLVMIGFAADAPPAPRAELPGRLAARGVKLTVFAPERLADPELERDAEERIRRALEGSGAAENRDARMAAVLDQMLADRVRLAGGAAESFRFPASGEFWAPAAALALGLALGALVLARKRSAPFAGAFAAGLVGAALEIGALVGYQVARGSLYAEISLVLAAFMAGGALGVSFLRRLPPTAYRPPSCAWPLLALAAAALATVALAVLGIEGLIGAALWIALVAATGAGVGATFAAASRASAPASAGMLYGLDLAGAALGGLLAVFVVPWAGLAAAALAGALLALPAALASALAARP